jgi:hypothetical protein
MRSHVQRTVARCFAALRPILSVRRSLSPTALETLVMSLVLTRLDYCNATLTRIPAKLLRCLQAECFCQDNRWTPTLTCPHCTASRCLSHPRCLSTQPTRVADIPSRRRLRSSTLLLYLSVLHDLSLSAVSGCGCQAMK